MPDDDAPLEPLTPEELDEPGIEDTHAEHGADGEFVVPTAPADELIDDAPDERRDGGLPLVDLD